MSHVCLSCDQSYRLQFKMYHCNSLFIYVIRYKLVIIFPFIWCFFFFLHQVAITASISCIQILNRKTLSVSSCCWYVENSWSVAWVCLNGEDLYCGLNNLTELGVKKRMFLECHVSFLQLSHIANHEITGFFWFNLKWSHWFTTVFGMMQMNYGWL